MTDLEQMIYTRSLENLYGSVLLGEDALNTIENLVYLTRELDKPKETKQSQENHTNLDPSHFLISNYTANL